MSTPALHRLAAPLETAADRIRALMRDGVERSIESLGLAVLSATAAQRSEILAAQFELDRRKSMFLLEFDRSFEQRLRRDCTPRDDGFAPPPSDWAELSLVAESEIETGVAAERLGLQMAATSEWELRELEGFLGTLLPHDPAVPLANPLRPARIARAMLDAAATLGERDDVRRTLVAALAVSLQESIGRCYAAIVDDMRRAGIVPAGLTVRTQESRLTEAPEDDAEAHAGEPGTGASRANGPGGRGAGPGAGSGGGGARMGEVDARMMSVMRRLASVPPELPVTEGAPGAGPVASNLIRAHRQELMEASRGGIDHLVIEVIGSLFDQILSDPKLPPAMLRQIARLQLPVLRAALGEPAFFSNRRHPVRLFVNRLASLGIALEDSEEAHVSQVMGKVAALVQEIVDGDFERIAVYEQRLTALETFTAESGRREIARQEVDAAALLQRKEEELQLHAVYAARLEAELREVPAADFLREFIARTWSQALVRACLADGPDAARTRQLQRTAIELLMSVQPKPTPEQRKAFLSALPALMRGVNEGLDLMAWPEAQRKAFFGRLLPAHSDAIRAAPTRVLDYNLLARRVEALFSQPLPTRADLPAGPAAPLPALSDEALAAPLSDDESRHVGLVRESSVDWSRAPQQDPSAEPVPQAEELRIDGLPEPTGAAEPTQGVELAQHLQIGFAYRMHLQGDWRTVRLAHISPGRGFFVFTHGPKHRETASLTQRMLLRLCESGRLRAFESAYLIERATARARRQLASLGQARTA